MVDNFCKRLSSAGVTASSQRWQRVHVQGTCVLKPSTETTFLINCKRQSTKYLLWFTDLDRITFSANYTWHFYFLVLKPTWTEFKISLISFYCRRITKSTYQGYYVPPNINWTEKNQKNKNKNLPLLSKATQKNSTNIN